jgi:co-chaperonin GroES (HSP10)
MKEGIRLDSKTVIRNVAGWTLLVRLDEIDKKQGLIELPGDTVMRRELAQTRGTVLSIAHGAWNDEPKPRCKVNDRVLFRQYAGEMLDVEGTEKYRIINDKDVYAVLEPISVPQTA